MLHEIRWTSNKIQKGIELLRPRIYLNRKPLAPFRFCLLEGKFKTEYLTQDFDDSSWKIVQTNDYWANPQTDFILRTHFRIPSDYSKSAKASLFLPLGISGDFSHPEALVFLDGEPFASCDRHHQEILLPDFIIDDNLHSLALHGWTGIGGSTVGDLTNMLKMGSCEIVQVNQQLKDFCRKSKIALDISDLLDENNPTKHHLLTSINNAFITLDLRYSNEDKLYDSIPEAMDILENGIRKSGPPLDVEISAIGHAHLDVAWLWTLNQSRKKTARTFFNALKLMETYPEFIYAQSQPQLYEFIRQDHPKVFDSIKELINQKRWEILGGMWVEADCNLTGSESLVRQLLLGRQFFETHFGKDSDSPVLWLPDVFGYAWNLPQLIKEAGLEYFFTIKIGWSQYNRLPYDSFWWQGLDGTRVLTHFSTTKNPESPFAATYNSDASPGQTLGTWMNFQQKDYGDPGTIPPLLMSYGYGDGGGGPTQEMIENIRIMTDFPATPRISTSRVIDFFRKLDTVSDNLPVWNGELYLEYHRGTYTTQARNKLANRKSETLLHNAEFLATYASLVDPNFRYPKSEFTTAWELVCLNQFHDIIPGSSIGPVYEESMIQYHEVNQIGTKICNDALNVLATKFGKSELFVNPTSFIRNEVMENNKEQYVLQDFQPYSIRSAETTSICQENINLSVSEQHIENDFIRIEINSLGDITRILDKSLKREVLSDGNLANQFLAFEDIPLSWDAWDIDIYYDDKVWISDPADRIKIIEAGPFRASIEIIRKILNSKYRQIISLTYNSPRIDFDTQIEWRERQTLLKVAFPIDVLTPRATYEIQWGNVERPTHRNTSWDWARFETAAQKWVDLSEGNFGVSLINDCKYGHDIHDNTIRLTLLRGTTAPDPNADIGSHEFLYSLLPHRGEWGLETVREAYSVNYPLLHFEANQKENSANSDKNTQINSLPSLFSINQTNIIIETIKKSEDGKGVIVRLYEYQRQRTEFDLVCAIQISEIWRVNLLEEKIENIAFSQNKIRYQIRPYQILTFMIYPSNGISIEDPH